MAKDNDRIMVSDDSLSPFVEQLLVPPCYNSEDYPVFFGSAHLDEEVRPCKVTLWGHKLFCSIWVDESEEVLYGGPFTILPFTEEMELVPAEFGRLPPGRSPVVGGHDYEGRPLYRALVSIEPSGPRVPAMAANHEICGGCSRWDGTRLPPV
ncbi:hypothetical protein BDN67DRAFT_1013904 [Paxillus ammoniavirescens]|nr:hypothetical protein BDN67DRAFT_1013904 [Paxillus ammoniavirescens]